MRATAEPGNITVTPSLALITMVGTLGYLGLAGRPHPQGREAGRSAGQTTKLELVITLNTAKALNLTLPLSLLGADDMIE